MERVAPGSRVVAVKDETGLKIILLYEASSILTL